MPDEIRDSLSAFLQKAGVTGQQGTIAPSRVNPQEYIKYMPSGVSPTTTNIDDLRGLRQTAGEQWRRFLPNLVTNTAQQILELPMDMMSYMGGNAEGVDLSAMHNLFGDIYREHNDGSLFDPRDPASWFQVSDGLISSMAAFAVPGGIIGRGIAGAARLAGGIRGATAAMNVGKVLTAGTMAFMEGAQIGAQTAQDVKQKELSMLLAQGYDLDTAEQLSHDTAREAGYRATWLNTIMNTALNMTMFLPFFRNAKDIVRREVTKGASALQKGEDIAQYAQRARNGVEQNAARMARELAASGGRSFLSESIQEGFEEINNSFAENRARDQTKKKTSIWNDLINVQQWAEEAMTKEGVFNFFTGMIGGAGQKLMFDHIPNFMTKESVPVMQNGQIVLDENLRPKYEQRYVSSYRREASGIQAEYASAIEAINEDYKHYNKALERLKAEKDPGKRNILRADLFATNALQSIERGYGDAWKKTYQDIADADNTTDYTAKLQEKKIELAKQLDSIPAEKAEDRAKLEGRLQEIDKQINENNGRTEAMVKGYAIDQNDNDYKDQAKEALSAIDEATGIFKQMNDKYGSLDSAYGTDYTGYMSHHRFHLNLRQRELEKLHKDITTNEAAINGANGVKGMADQWALNYQGAVDRHNQAKKDLDLLRQVIDGVASPRELQDLQKRYALPPITPANAPYLMRDLNDRIRKVNKEAVDKINTDNELIESTDPNVGGDIGELKKAYNTWKQHPKAQNAGFGDFIDYAINSDPEVASLAEARKTYEEESQAYRVAEDNFKKLDSYRGVREYQDAIQAHNAELKAKAEAKIMKDNAEAKKAEDAKKNAQDQQVAQDLTDANAIAVEIARLENELAIIKAKLDGISMLQRVTTRRKEYTKLKKDSRELQAKITELREKLAAINKPGGGAAVDASNNPNINTNPAPSPGATATPATNGAQVVASSKVDQSIRVYKIQSMPFRPGNVPSWQAAIDEIYGEDFRKDMEAMAAQQVLRPQDDFAPDDAILDLAMDHDLDFETNTELPFLEQAYTAFRAGWYQMSPEIRYGTMLGMVPESVRIPVQAEVEKYYQSGAGDEIDMNAGKAEAIAAGIPQKDMTMLLQAGQDYVIDKLEKEEPGVKPTPLAGPIFTEASPKPGTGTTTQTQQTTTQTGSDTTGVTVTPPDASGDPNRPADNLQKNPIPPAVAEILENQKFIKPHLPIRVLAFDQNGNTLYSELVEDNPRMEIIGTIGLPKDGTFRQSPRADGSTDLRVTYPVDGGSITIEINNPKGSKLDMQALVKAVKTSWEASEGKPTQERISQVTDDARQLIMQNKDYTHYKNIKNGNIYLRGTSVDSDAEQGGANNPLLETSQALGTKTDVMVRDFLDNTLKDDLTQYDLVDNPQLLIPFLDDLGQLEELLAARGETIVAKNVVVYDDIHKVAGMLDLMTYDQQGNVNIYDMKTMRGDQYNQKYAGESVVKYKSNRYGKSNEQKHRNQLSTYRAAIMNTHRVNVAKIGIIPIELMYNAGDKHTSVINMLSIAPKEMTPLNKIGHVKVLTEQELAALNATPAPSTSTTQPAVTQDEKEQVEKAKTAVHEAAKAANININEPWFHEKSGQLTTKEKLDEMNVAQLNVILKAIQDGTMRPVTEVSPDIIADIEARRQKELSSLKGEEYRTSEDREWVDKDGVTNIARVITYNDGDKRIIIYGKNSDVIVDEDYGPTVSNDDIFKKHVKAGTVFNKISSDENKTVTAINAKYDAELAALRQPPAAATTTIADPATGEPVTVVAEAPPPIEVTIQQPDGTTTTIAAQPPAIEVVTVPIPAVAPQEMPVTTDATADLEKQLQEARGRKAASDAAIAMAQQQVDALLSDIDKATREQQALLDGMVDDAIAGMTPEQRDQAEKEKAAGDTVEQHVKKSFWQWLKGLYDGVLAPFFRSIKDKIRKALLILNVAAITTTQVTGNMQIGEYVDMAQNYSERHLNVKEDAPMSSVTIQPTTVAGTTTARMDDNMGTNKFPYKGGYVTNQIINLDSNTFEIRHRGDTRPAEHVVGITGNLFKPFQEVKDFKGILGRGDEATRQNPPVIAFEKATGRIKAGNLWEFDSSWLVSETFSLPMDFQLDANGKIQAKYHSQILRYTPMMTNANGNEVSLPIGVDGKAATIDPLKHNTFGVLEGGKVIMVVGDYQIQVNGGFTDMYKAWESLKATHPGQPIIAYLMDNGSYNLPILKDNGTVTSKDLQDHTRRNKDGGTCLLLKQKEVQKDAQYPHGIQKILTGNFRKDSTGQKVVNEPKAIILHHTGEYKGGEQAVINEFTAAHGNSSHYLIGKDGKIYQFNDGSYVMFHAGKSTFKGMEDMNAHSIGIEIQGDSKDGGFTQAQYESLIPLIHQLAKTYNIPVENVTTHTVIRDNYLKAHPEDKETQPKRDLNDAVFKVIIDKMTPGYPETAKEPDTVVLTGFPEGTKGPLDIPASWPLGVMAAMGGLDLALRAYHRRKEKMAENKPEPVSTPQEVEQMTSVDATEAVRQLQARLDVHKKNLEGLRKQAEADDKEIDEFIRQINEAKRKSNEALAQAEVVAHEQALANAQPQVAPTVEVQAPPVTVTTMPFDQIAPTGAWGSDEHGRFWQWLKDTGRDQEADLIRNLNPDQSRQLYLVYKIQAGEDGEQQAQEVLNAIQNVMGPTVSKAEEALMLKDYAADFMHWAQGRSPAEISDGRTLLFNYEKNLAGRPNARVNSLSSFIVSTFPLDMHELFEPFRKHIMKDRADRKAIREAKRAYIARAREVAGDELRDPESLVIGYFLAGGRVNTEAIQKLFGDNKDKSLTGERRARIGIISNTAPTMSEIAHSIYESMDEQEQLYWQTHGQSYDFMQDAVENVIRNHPTKSDMAKDIHDKLTRAAVEKDMTDEEHDLFRDKSIKKVMDIVGNIPDHIVDDVTLFFMNYMQPDGTLDWDQLNEATEGFNTDFLNLPDEAAEYITNAVRQARAAAESELSAIVDQGSDSTKAEAGDQGANAAVSQAAVEGQLSPAPGQQQVQGPALTPIERAGLQEEEEDDNNPSAINPDGAQLSPGILEYRKRTNGFVLTNQKLINSPENFSSKHTGGPITVQAADKMQNPTIDYVEVALNVKGGEGQKEYRRMVIPDSFNPKKLEGIEAQVNGQAVYIKLDKDYVGGVNLDKYDLKEGEKPGVRPQKDGSYTRYTTDGSKEGPIKNNDEAIGNVPIAYYDAKTGKKLDGYMPTVSWVEMKYPGSENYRNVSNKDGNVKKQSAALMRVRRKLVEAHNRNTSVEWKMGTTIVGPGDGKGYFPGQLTYNVVASPSGKSYGVEQDKFRKLIPDPNVRMAVGAANAVTFTAGVTGESIPLPGAKRGLVYAVAKDFDGSNVIIPVIMPDNTEADAEGFVETINAALGMDSRTIDDYKDFQDFDITTPRGLRDALVQNFTYVGHKDLKASFDEKPAKDGSNYLISITNDGILQVLHLQEGGNRSVEFDLNNENELSNEVATMLRQAVLSRPRHATFRDRTIKGIGSEGKFQKANWTPGKGISFTPKYLYDSYDDYLKDIAFTSVYGLNMTADGERFVYTANQQTYIDPAFSEPMAELGDTEQAQAIIASPKQTETVLDPDMEAKRDVYRDQGKSESEIDRILGIQPYEARTLDGGVEITTEMLQNLSNLAKNHTGVSVADMENFLRQQGRKTLPEDYNPFQGCP